MTEVAVTQLRHFDGSIMVFQGIDEDGVEVTFAAEHRAGADILAALEDGEDPVAIVPDYMFLGRRTHPE